MKFDAKSADRCLNCSELPDRSGQPLVMSMPPRPAVPFAPPQITSNDAVASVGEERLIRFVVPEETFRVDVTSGLPALVMLSVRYPPIAPADAVVAVAVPSNTDTDCDVVKASMP